MLIWIFLFTAVLLLIELFNAPEGWEDDEGFHYGKK